MDTTSSHTVLSTLSEFNYFKPTVIQSSITEEYDEEFLCSNLSPHGTTLDFFIPAVTGIFRDLSNTFLEVECKVVKGNIPNTTDIDANDAVAPVNNFLHSLFSDCDISICGTRTTERESLYPYRAVIEQLLSSSRDVLETRAKLAGWDLDMNADAMDRTIIAAANNVDPNPQTLTRRKLIEGSRLCTLIGRIHCDISHQDLDIPPECKIHIKLVRAPNEFVLMAAENSNYKVAIHSARLLVRSKKVTPELLMAQREMLSVSPFKIPFAQVGLRKLQIPRGQTSHSFQNVTPGKLPRRVVVALIQQDRINGKFNLNPFKFENFDLNRLVLTVNGTPIPRTPLEMDYSDKNYQHAYLNTLIGLGLDIGNNGIVLTPELWAKAYNLYAFKISPGPIDCGIESSKLSGTINLEFNFGTVTAQPIEVILYSETNRMLEIDEYNASKVI